MWQQNSYQGHQVKWWLDGQHKHAWHTTSFLLQVACRLLSGHAKLQLIWLIFGYLLITLMRRLHTLAFSSKATAEWSSKRRSLIYDTLTSEERSVKSSRSSRVCCFCFFILKFRQCKIRKKYCLAFTADFFKLFWSPW